MGGLILIPHVVHHGLEGGEVANVNQTVFTHFGSGHVGRIIVRAEGERGFSEGAYAEAGESSRIPKWPMVCAVFERISSLRGSFPTVRATVDQGRSGGRDAKVLAGDPKRKG